MLIVELLIIQLIILILITHINRSLRHTLFVLTVGVIKRQKAVLQLNLT